MKHQGHTTERSLPAQGQRGVVRAVFAIGATSMNTHPICTQRPFAALADDYWMQPGEGSA